QHFRHLGAAARSLDTVFAGIWRPLSNDRISPRQQRESFISRETATFGRLERALVADGSATLENGAACPLKVSRPALPRYNQFHEHPKCWMRMLVFEPCARAAMRRPQYSQLQNRGETRRSAALQGLLGVT